MNANFKQKEINRDNLFSKIVLVLQTLLYEEVIKRNTFDKLQSLVIDMDKNNPTKHDFLGEIFSNSQKTEIISTVASKAEDAWISNFEFNGEKYQIQLKKIY